MTTILSVRHEGRVAIGGDGQVSFGETAVKHNASKIRKLKNVIVGFAGATADAFSLLERFEAKLKEYEKNIKKAAVELAKDWRTDKVLRRLESQMIVIDRNISLLISGNGDVLEPDDGIIGIGSGGQYATAAAKALVIHSNLSAKEIVEEALKITAKICIYTNENIVVEDLRYK